MAPFFRLVLYAVIFFMFGQDGVVALSVDMAETELESEPNVGDASTAVPPSLADFTASSEEEGATITTAADTTDSDTAIQADDTTIVPDVARSDELPELTRLMLAYQQNLARTASSSSDDEHESIEQPMLDANTENGSIKFPNDSRVSDTARPDRGDDVDHDNETASAARFDSPSRDPVAMINKEAADHADSEPNPRHQASNLEPSDLPVDCPAVIEQVANVNDHLHAAAEAIKETIRSEDKEAATIPLHRQEETLVSHGDLHQEVNGRDPRVVVAAPTLTIIDDESGDDEDEAEVVDSKTDRMESSRVVDEQDEDTASVPDDDFDDRTLLDIFGESAKEYLTQRVIPDTDADCLWDWRSLRCEPSCECSFQFKSGDYHLGRSCRRRSATLDVCEPTVFVQDKPIPKRILSLVRQSTDILKENIKETARKVVQSTTRQYGQLQEHVCLDLWSRLHDNPATGIRCWSSVPETTTLPEKLLCGPIEGPMCDDEPLRGTKSPFATAATAATRMDRRKDTIFGDLYEKEF